MASYDHLTLVRLPEKFERRKRRGFGSRPNRNEDFHGRKLLRELDAAEDSYRARPRPEYVDPDLILRVTMAGGFMYEEDWEALGFTVLSHNDDRTLILFSSSEEMVDFRTRVERFLEGVPEGQKHRAYADFVCNVEEIGIVDPRDRIGVRAKEEGFSDIADFSEDEEYLVDIELWDFGQRHTREKYLAELIVEANEFGGAHVDTYIGPSITLVRLKCSGAGIQHLLTNPAVSQIDFPPSPEGVQVNPLNLAIDDLPAVSIPEGDLPIIGVIDSGVNYHPLLEPVHEGSIVVPEDMDPADKWGHGTSVAGIAAYGDLRDQLKNGSLTPYARICSAKVVDEHGRFPENILVPRQMREAVERLNDEHGCRVFVISLGDRNSIFDGNKVGLWAATLDELVRERDIIIAVSAGNSYPEINGNLEEAVTNYPRYLLSQNNRFFEPAGAVNVVSVGAIAHHHGVPAALAGEVGVRPISEKFEPAPFTRSGLGLRNGIKPDFVDFGGTLIFDPVAARLRDGSDVPDAGVISLNNAHVERLFTSGSGTSFAAPLLALKASSIMHFLGNPSANLVRALLGISANVSEEMSAKVRVIDSVAQHRVCGNGLVDVEKAVRSDESRVVLYAEDRLEIDKFAVYQIPIPEEFQLTNGVRKIKISLSFSPPVRSSRLDYMGVTMDFRLIRGCDEKLVFEHFKKRNANEEIPAILKRFNCDVKPGANIRDRSALQVGEVTFQRDISHYGDTYFLVVRCNGGWAPEELHDYAVAVQISHEAEIQLYERLRQRLRVTA